MNTLERKLKELNPDLYSKFLEAKKAVSLLLAQYSANFPTYTDHSINHTIEVFNIASDILHREEVNLLNEDEIYILSMACILHDIGMCIPENKIQEIADSQNLIEYKKSHAGISIEQYLRDIHHELSNLFILQEWQNLSIPSLQYAKAIGLVAKGHRKEDLSNFDIYKPRFFAKSGTDFTCLPYLASILRIADELDITNSRTPRILTKYYMPNNDVSIKEWTKHINTSQRNYYDDKVLFHVDCSDEKIYSAHQEQFEKIQNVINYCQKTIRSIPFIDNKQYFLNLSSVEIEYNFIKFDPKGIRFSFDVQNVVNAFVGEDLYNDRFTAIREAIQNSIDSCRYKNKILKEDYLPSIKVFIDNKSLKIEDNGAGMDDFIIENYFGKLGSSYYEQEKIKNQFEAIGQFGVGVFSYFMLSQYVDIETKLKDQPTRKFRFDKDPKSYFHFFDITERINSGTTLSMFFKDEIAETINFLEIENYIRMIFTHIEFPIEIIGETNAVTILNQSFQINEAKEIFERIKIQHKNIASKLKIIEFYINDEDMEGNCGLIVAKNYLQTFSYNHKIFDSDQFISIRRGNTTSQISISQKGVYVNNYFTAYLDYFFGKINLKKKIKINIDRNEFSDESQIINLIFRFETKIIEKTFEIVYAQTEDLEERLAISNDFLKNYSGYIGERIIPKEFIDVICKYIYVKTFEEGKELILNIQTLNETMDNIVLVNENDMPINIKETILLSFDEIYRWSYNYFRVILNRMLNYKIYILEVNEKRFVKFTKQTAHVDQEKNIAKIRQAYGNKYLEIIPSNSKKFILHPDHEMRFSDSIYLMLDTINYNHHFIQFIILNYDEIIKRNESLQRIRASISFIEEFVNEKKINTESIKKLNKLLLGIHPTEKHKNFKISDF